MAQAIFIIAALFTICGGIFWVMKNWKWIKNTLAEWTRRGIKVIYVWVSHNNKGTVFLYLYLCGEEKSWLFSGPCHKNCDSYILAIKKVRYGTSYDTYSDREDIMAEWHSQVVHPLSKEKNPVLVQLIGKSRLRFEFNSDNGEKVIFSDSFKFKKELSEWFKKVPD